MELTRDEYAKELGFVDYASLEKAVSKDNLMMPNFCPYCGSKEMYEPNPKTSTDGPYCDNCGANVQKVSKQEYYLNADVSLTQEMIQDGISEGFQDYAGGSNARTTIKSS